ncbi:MAG: UDP-N-acetylmuramate dehydrogenase [Candidatus Schekmanbacteria bacterium]|nr:UDP-N-acetylmuramate dehydrogenase [Candidatus Schekmanbacteria bacterium]
METRAGVELGPLTTYRIGGRAQVFAEPRTEASVVSLLQWAEAEGRRVWILGGGSNVLVPDEGLSGVVLRINRRYGGGDGVSWQDTAARPEAHRDGSVCELEVDAGRLLPWLASWCSKQGLCGAQAFYGIPGTVGGATAMNAGALGSSWSDITVAVRLADASGSSWVPTDAIAPAYRTSALAAAADDTRARPRVVTRVRLRLMAAPAEELRARIAREQKRRTASQPYGLPSAGCVFRNPPGAAAGQLIDATGLKGERRGDIAVSNLHANFFVNRGRGTAADVLSLMLWVRRRVHERYGVLLEPEIHLLGSLREQWRAETAGRSG